MAGLVILGAEVAGRSVDVRNRGERIENIGALAPEPGETVLPARGRTDLPEGFTSAGPGRSSDR